jgi:hypothetical protein
LDPSAQERLPVEFRRRSSERSEVLEDGAKVTPFVVAERRLRRDRRADVEALHLERRLDAGRERIFGEGLMDTSKNPVVTGGRGLVLG